MAFNPDSINRYVGDDDFADDQRQKQGSLSSSEDRRSDLANENGNYGTGTRGFIRDTIVKEAEHGATPDSETPTYSSYTLSTIISGTKDNLEEECSDAADIIFVDGGEGQMFALYISY